MRGGNVPLLNLRCTFTTPVFASHKRGNGNVRTLQ
jgi:hypothetical protein